MKLKGEGTTTASALHDPSHPKQLQLLDRTIIIRHPFEKLPAAYRLLFRAIFMSIINGTFHPECMRLATQRDKRLRYAHS